MDMGSKQVGEYGYSDQHQQPYVAQPVYLDAPSAPPVQAHEVVPQPYTGPVSQQVQHVVGVTVITQPQELHGPQRGNLTPVPPTYCCLAWFSCLFCCCPIGLFAVFMSMAVSDRMNRRDFEGAYRASETARKAALAAILIGACIQIISYVYEAQTVSDSGDDSGSSRQN